MASTKAVRRLLSEIRHTLSQPQKLKDAKITQYIMTQYKKHQITERQNCKAAQEMTHLADSYVTYLESQRKWKDVHEEYHHGELSTQQIAGRVGFKLPHDPK